MPTNKKKKSSTTNTKKDKGIDNMSTTTAPLQGPPPVGPLPKGRFHILLLLSIGISRLVQWRGATKLNDDDDDNATANSTCVDYLGASACEDKAVQTMLHLKFASGVQCALLVMAVAMHLWYNEATLRQFNSLLVVSPIVASVVVMYLVAFDSDTFVPRRYFWQHFFLCLVLTAVVKPNVKKEWPFIGQERVNKQPTLQGLTLITLAGLFLYQALCIIFPNIFLQTGSGGDGDKVVFDQFADYAISGIHGKPHAAAHVISMFLAVDRLLYTGICAFMFYHVNEQFQRSFLVFIAIVHAFTYWKQLPYFADKLSDCYPILRAMDLMIAILTIIAAVAPEPMLYDKKGKKD